jgi:hypothetical protein
MIRYVRRPNCETIVLDNETMILNPDGMTITRISEAGFFCWSQLSEMHSFDSLSAAVREHYGETELAVEQDISEFLQQLLECGLIETRD